MAGYKSMSLPSGRNVSLRIMELTRITVSHPNVAEIFIRIQTDGSITPKEAFVAVCQKLLRDFTHLSQEFAREWELRRMVNEGEQQNQDGNV